MTQLCPDADAHEWTLEIFSLSWLVSYIAHPRTQRAFVIIRPTEAHETLQIPWNEFCKYDFPSGKQGKRIFYPSSLLWAGHQALYILDIMQPWKPSTRAFLLQPFTHRDSKIGACVVGSVLCKVLGLGSALLAGGYHALTEQSLMCNSWDSNSAVQRKLRGTPEYVWFNQEATDVWSDLSEKAGVRHKLEFKSGRIIDTTQQCDSETDTAAAFYCDINSVRNPKLNFCPYKVGYKARVEIPR